MWRSELIEFNMKTRNHKHDTFLLLYTLVGLLRLRQRHLGALNLILLDWWRWRRRWLNDVEFLVVVGGGAARHAHHIVVGHFRKAVAR